MRVVNAEDVEGVVKNLTIRARNTRDDTKIDTYYEAIDLLQEVLKNATERDT